MSLIIAKLTRGPRTLNINDLTNYELGADFNPPAVAIDPVYARSGSDWWTPGKLVGIKAQDRSFTFGLHVYGTTEATVRTRMRILNDFLISGTQAEPVYLEVLGNSDLDFQPLWGQSGAYYRYEIITGKAEINAYAFGGIRDSALPECNVNLMIAPYALGRRQILGLSTGCIIEDTLGAADGLSRGITVDAAVTNAITNPVFGNATWNTGWTANGSLIAVQNIDKNYTLPDRPVSAKLTSPTLGTNSYTQSYTTTEGLTKVISLYVRRPEGGAVTADYCAVWYDTLQSSTYESVGNGIYRVWASVTILAGARLVGIRVINGYTVYLLGAQIESGSHWTPLIHGDMLGCSWAGTRHASASTSLAGEIKVYGPSIFNVNQGTIRIVWKPSKIYTGYSANAMLFSNNGDTFQAYYDFVNHCFVFTDGVVTLSSSAVTFNPNETMVLHFIWGAVKMYIYRNGVNISSTGGAFTPPAIPTYLYIGSSAACTLHCGGVLMGFTAFDRMMSAAQVLADYTNQAGIVTADKRVDWIPYLNTIYGSGRIYNANTYLTSYKWGAINSVPGSMPADTEWEGYLSPSWSTIKSLWLSLLDTDLFVYQNFEMNMDNSGSADAACEGGEYESNTVSTTEITDFDAIVQNVFTYPAFAGREYALFVRLQDASGASGLQGRNRFALYSQTYSTDLQSIASSTSWRTWISPMLTFIPISVTNVAMVTLLRYYSFERFVPIRTAGSWALKVDYIMAMFRPLVRLRSTGTIDEHNFYFHGREAFLHTDVVPLYIHERLSVKGDVLDLVPEKWNILTLHMGDTDFDPVITYYTELWAVTITPRWGLL